MSRKARTATGLTAGVLKSQRRLDLLMSPYLTKPQKLAPGLQNMLRLAAYELIVCQRPLHIVNEYVQLAKKLSHPRAAGLINGECALQQLGSRSSDAFADGYGWGLFPLMLGTIQSVYSCQGILVPCEPRLLPYRICCFVPLLVMCIYAGK